MASTYSSDEVTSFFAGEVEFPINICGQIESMGFVYEGVSCSSSNGGMGCSSVDSSTQPHDADSCVSNLESSDFEVILRDLIHTAREQTKNGQVLRVDLFQKEEIKEGRGRGQMDQLLEEWVEEQ